MVESRNEDGATSVEIFRTISLLIVEGKLYFALWSDRLVTYTFSNKYIDTSIQKGGVPGFSGRMEYTAILSQLISPLLHAPRLCSIFMIKKCFLSSFTSLSCNRFILYPSHQYFRSYGEMFFCDLRNTLHHKGQSYCCKKSIL